MARRQVIILECDRCGRTEDQGPGLLPTDGPNPEPVPVVRINSVLHDPPANKIYSDLCTTCKRSVTALLDKIFLIKKEGSEE